ncbi:MAG: HD domain-containing protein [Chloroflexi bacterium]|nr:HD domain-containing protein [Chloroflexota bacterium]
MDDNLRQVALALLVPVGARDPQLRSHCEYVAQVSANIARGLQLSPGEVDEIWVAAMVHDVGKVAIPLEVLRKPGVLNEYERRLVESHVNIGTAMLRECCFPIQVHSMAAQHHERLNGSGYPGHVAGNEIVLGAKILAVADVFAAMTSERPYRTDLQHDETVRYLQQNTGVLFDPAVVEAITKNVTPMGVAGR